MNVEIKNEISVKEFNELRNSVGWENKDTYIVEEALQKSVIIKKAVLDHKVVGMARVIGDGVYYLVVDVVVKEECQGKGIGKMMINEIVKDIDFLTDSGQSSSIILIANNGKEEFYEKCGFIKVPYDFTGYGMMKRIEK